MSDGDIKPCIGKEDPGTPVGPISPILSPVRRERLSSTDKSKQSDITQFLEADSDHVLACNQLLQHYCKTRLVASANTHEIADLHEGVRKTIAARASGIESAFIAEENLEDQYLRGLNILSERLLNDIHDELSRSNLAEIRTLVCNKSSNTSKKLLELLAQLQFASDIPDDIMDATEKDFESRLTPITNKSRGRPKKLQAKASTFDDDSRRELFNKSREAHLAFALLLQYMLYNCSNYLRGTRSRILLNLSDKSVVGSDDLASKPTPVIVKPKQEPMTTEPQQDDSTIETSVRKLIALDADDANAKASRISDDYCRQNRSLEVKILESLQEAHRCLLFLTSHHVVITRLWQKFVAENHISDLDWYHRFTIDGAVFSNNYACCIDTLKIYLEALDERDTTKSVKQESHSPLRVPPTVIKHDQVRVSRLRALTQIMSCYNQLQDKADALASINKLLTCLRQYDLLNPSHMDTNGLIEEYFVMMGDSQGHGLGFLFFDSISIIRHCRDILMNKLRPLTIKNSDTTDTSIGHTIVLSQLDWPRESDIYDHCMCILRSNKPKSTTPQSLSASTKFTYPDFFDYIRNPEMIEDFIALLNQGYTLDIKSSAYLMTSNPGMAAVTTNVRSAAQNQRSTKAITTRGVNKTFKEDLKVALIAQMRCSSFLLPIELVSEFIRASLIPYLIANA